MTKRETIKTKMSAALSENMQMLSPGMQEILLDDLVTAFENRLRVLVSSKSKIQLVVFDSIKETAEIDEII